jgi:hypothetical protein
MKLVTTNDEINDKSNNGEEECSDQDEQSVFAALTSAPAIPIGPYACDDVEYKKSKDKNNDKGQYDEIHETYTSKIIS